MSAPASERATVSPRLAAALVLIVQPPPWFRCRRRQRLRAPAESPTPGRAGTAAAGYDGRSLRRPGAGGAGQRLRRCHRRSLDGDRAAAAERASSKRTRDAELVSHSPCRRPHRMDQSTIVGKTNPNFSVDAILACQGIRAPRPARSRRRRRRATEGPRPAPDARRQVFQRRPMGRPLEAIIPAIDPKQGAAAVAVAAAGDGAGARSLAADRSAAARATSAWYDPYNPNTLKGDRPVFGEDWFVNARRRSRDTCSRRGRLPTPIGAQSTQRPAVERRVRPRQAVDVRRKPHRSACRCIKGDTAFKPPEFEFRFVPVLNFNRTHGRGSARASTSIRARARTRNDNFARRAGSVRRLPVSATSRRATTSTSVRVGIQPFIVRLPRLPVPGPAARRAPLRQARQQPLAVQPRRGSGGSRRTPTAGSTTSASALRDDDVFVANLYRQDFPVPGFTLAGTRDATTCNREDAEPFYDDNGFPVRPALLGDVRAARLRRRLPRLQRRRPFRPLEPDRRRSTARSGTTTAIRSSQQTVDISALFAAAELSRDFDWIRVRGSALLRERRRRSVRRQGDRLRRDLREPAVRRRRHQLLDPPGGAADRRRRRRALGPQRRARERCARRRSRVSRTSTIPGSCCSASAPTST